MTWAAFLVFSTITLGSVVEVAKNNDQYVNQSKSAETWSIVCASLTFAINVIVVIMHLNAVTSLLIVGTKLEGSLATILVAFWAATVAIVSDSSKGLAVDEIGAVVNGNLYYFSWAGFVCSVLLLVSFLRDIYGVDVAGEIRARSVRLTTWSAHLACSMVVMGASANAYDTTCYAGVQGKGKYCRRAVFGIVLGVLATLIAVSIVGMKIATASSPFLVEATLSILLLISYAFEVAFITSQEGPGAPLGNLYYFSWLSFITAFLLSASCFEDYNAAKNMAYQQNQQPEQNVNDNELQVESLDDQI
jgi:hypothetical protein